MHGVGIEPIPTWNETNSVTGWATQPHSKSLPTLLYQGRIKYSILMKIDNGYTTLFDINFEYFLLDYFFLILVLRFFFLSFKLLFRCKLLFSCYTIFLILVLSFFFSKFSF